MEWFSAGTDESQATFLDKVLHRVKSLASSRREPIPAATVEHSKQELSSNATNGAIVNFFKARSVSSLKKQTSQSDERHIDVSRPLHVLSSPRVVSSTRGLCLPVPSHVCKSAGAESHEDKMESNIGSRAVETYVPGTYAGISSDAKSSTEPTHDEVIPRHHIDALIASIDQCTNEARFVLKCIGVAEPRSAVFGVILRLDSKALERMRSMMYTAYRLSKERASSSFWTDASWEATHVILLRRMQAAMSSHHELRHELQPGRSQGLRDARGERYIAGEYTMVIKHFSTVEDTMLRSPIFATSTENSLALNWSVRPLQHVLRSFDIADRV